MKRIKEIYKKCEQCIKYDKETKSCSYYNDLAYNHYIDCMYDKRIICKHCERFDPETSNCTILDFNKFKNANSLRICDDFVFLKGE